MNTAIDLFSGIGGFHIAAQENGIRCVFASDIDAVARQSYFENYGLMPHGDIRSIRVEDIPKHDLLCAGFPCQPFSIIGKRKGFDDIRGTLFFDIIRIIEAKKPVAAVLENVRQLKSHNGGHTLKRIMQSLGEVGYHADYHILNALDFGLPQKRERIIIVAFRNNRAFKDYKWPCGHGKMIPLSRILQRRVSQKYYASPRIRDKRRESHISKYRLSIWHENKGGNISSHPFSCALRAGASYNYLLVNGERRLTPREMLRLQGFPNDFKIVCNDGQTRKQAGNAVPVPVISEVIKEVKDANQRAETARH